MKQFICLQRTLRAIIVMVFLANVGQLLATFWPQFDGSELHIAKSIIVQVRFERRPTFGGHLAGVIKIGNCWSTFCRKDKSIFHEHVEFVAVQKCVNVENKCCIVLQNAAE